MNNSITICFPLIFGTSAQYKFSCNLLTYAVTEVAFVYFFFSSISSISFHAYLNGSNFETLIWFRHICSNFCSARIICLFFILESFFVAQWLLRQVHMRKIFTESVADRTHLLQWWKLLLWKNKRWEREEREKESIAPWPIQYHSPGKYLPLDILSSGEIAPV